MRVSILPSSRVEWAFGLAWVSATTVGWVVGFAVCEFVKNFSLPSATEGVVLGTSIGITQWLALKGRINRAGWWILASFIGFGVGKFVGDAIAQEVSGALGSGLSGATIGASLGLAQWLVLRRQVAQAGWWVLVSVLGWAVGWSIISFVDEVANTPTGTAYLIGAAGAAVAGVITAVLLMRILRLRPA